MRMLMIVQMPIDSFNAAARNGTVAATMRRILEDTKPESAHFTELDGRRAGILVVDVKSAADIPRLSEPWFLQFNAEVQFRIAMTVEDLAQADLAGLGKKWG